MEASRHRGTYRTLSAKDKTARLQPQRFRHDRVELHSRGIPTPLQYAVRHCRVLQIRHKRTHGGATQYRNVGGYELGIFQGMAEGITRRQEEHASRNVCSVVAARLFRLVCNGCLLANSLLLDVTNSDNCCNSIGFMENL